MIYKAEYSYFVDGIRYTDFFCIEADDVGCAYADARAKLFEYPDRILLFVSPDYSEQFEFDFFS